MSTITQSAVEEIIETKLKSVKHAIKDLRQRVNDLEVADFDGAIRSVRDDLEGLDGHVMELEESLPDKY